MSIYSQPPNPNNASIDRVIYQVNQLASQINGFTYNAEVAGGEVADRGKQTFELMKHNFQTDTMTNVDRLLHIFTDKTNNWPMYILLGAAAIGIISFFLWLFLVCTRGVYKLAQFRYQKRVIRKAEILI